MAENFTYDFIGDHLKIAEGSGGWNLELNKNGALNATEKIAIRACANCHAGFDPASPSLLLINTTNTEAT